MKLKKRRLYMLALAIVICGSVALGGCASGGKTESGEEALSEEENTSGEEALSEEENTSGEESASQGNNVGEFSMQDIEGQAYTQEMFADYDLTMVNVFTTWCSPCVNEIPKL